MAADPADDPRPPRKSALRDAHLVEERVDSEQVFAGKLLDVRRDHVRLPDGRIATREYIVHPGAVLIVPMTDDGHVVIERQFRYPLNAVFTEFPAGKRDPGETPLATARRELREETGYTATAWTHLGTVHMVISYSTEAIELYLAQGLQHGASELDHGEFLEIETRALDDLVAAADRGEITDVKTIAALHFLERLRRPGPPIAWRMVVTGRVQGVGFRYAMNDVARAAGVSGWVRNCMDGSVEVQLQGAQPALARLVQWARRGPPGARVTGVEVSRAPFDVTRNDFAVRPSDD